MDQGNHRASVTNFARRRRRCATGAGAAQMLNRQLQTALHALDTAIQQLRERGIAEDIIIAALARQLYNHIQLRTAGLSGPDAEDA